VLLVTMLRVTMLRVTMLRVTMLRVTVLRVSVCRHVLAPLHVASHAPPTSPPDSGSRGDD
jgi:hypothetical protein